MSNRWGIPKHIEDLVQARDLDCVYCRKKFEAFDTSRKRRKSWEHIINDIRRNGEDNIALCCISCNASKGNKKLKDWLQGKYCLTNAISPETVAAVVQNHLKEQADNPESG